MKKFNINDSVYIKITECGWSHLRKTVSHDFIKNSIEPYKVIIDGQTWYKLSCWGVFELLPCIHGGSLLFETTIMLDNDTLN